MRHYKVARVADLKENRGFLVRVAGEEISLFKIDGEILAIGNVCPHQHFSKLHDGEIKGCTVTCPMHGWTYDLRSGVSTNGSGRVKTYSIEVRQDEVFLLRDGDAD
ncbi:MAG TPA: Rieske 2Fe-2S domain-containing protein [Bacteroidota bacterium]|nr:Rieske 2Fe-2S domain-containing protein [Bacteroidota bacterium]